MEAIGSLDLTEASGADTSHYSDHIYWKRCFICQSIKRPAKKFPLSQASAEGIERVIFCAEVREHYNDLSFEHTLERLKNVNLRETEKQVLWHRTCYGSFTNKEHIQRLQKRVLDRKDAETDKVPSDVSQSRPRRSQVDPVDWARCIFCQGDFQGLNQVQTFETSKKILEKSSIDPIMRCRLAGINDLIAAEGKYHLKCYAKFQRATSQLQPKHDESCFHAVMNELQSGISKGHIYSLKSVWSYFCEKHQSTHGCQPGTFKSDRFKNKVKESLGNKVVFIQPLNPSESLLMISADLGEAALQSILQESQVNCVDGEKNGLSLDALEDVNIDTELLSWLFRVAIKVHQDIKVTPGQENIGNIDIQSAEKVVPDTLYMLIRLLCAGEVDTTDESNTELDVDLKRKVLSICQDIVFLSSRGRKRTPKHVGIGLTVHQATRSKELVEWGHSTQHSRLHSVEWIKKKSGNP
jgi:hypothetical protein